jgi:hypothetical protein
MIRLKSAIIVLILLTSFGSYGQKYSYKKKFGTQKNTMYFYWGYNRSGFTKSNINFVGPDYNFTAIDVAARDKPENDFKKYFSKDFTVPQFNIRVGWYYKFRWDWSVGYDHMKYVMRENQELFINGFIDGTDNVSLTNGTYTDANGKIPILPNELDYENTNGLNYISVQLSNTAPIWKTNNNKFAIIRRVGGGVGPVVTQTDFQWDSQSYNSTLKFGGYGISAHAGVRFDFFQRFFLMSNWSAGFIHLPKNETIQRQGHYAKHKFLYGQWELVGGVLWYLRTKNACDTCPDWH